MYSVLLIVFKISIIVEPSAVLNLHKIVFDTDQIANSFLRASIGIRATFVVVIDTNCDTI